MIVYDFLNKALFEKADLLENSREQGKLFILCRTHEISILQTVFDLDESTVLNCTDLDESIRYTNFDGYDFISMIHIEISEFDFVLREINLYISSHYLILVLPEHESPKLSAWENILLNSLKTTVERSEPLIGMYYLLFHHLLSDFSDTLETLEDRMQFLSEEIVLGAEKTHFAQIITLKNMTYGAKKQLRALSYLGDQILLDENKLIDKEKIHYFRNINTRLKKLYDFSESLYNLGSEMLYTYDSRLTMKTNDMVNKLTVLTLFFGPLTVITGIYGMNFDFMPELHWPFGYLYTILLMIGITLLLFIILKKKKWL